jgi:hypothetical protein
MATLASPTIEELIIEARRMLNQPDANNSFWSDEELIDYANQAARRYFTEVVMHSEGQFTATADLDLVSGVNTVSLPSDCFRVKGLWRAVSNGYEPLYNRNNLNEGISTSQAASGSLFRPDYSFRGNSLVLSQTPGFDETAGLKLEYIQFPATLVTGGDALTSQISPVFRDLIIAFMIWRAKGKESLVTGTDTTSIARANLDDLFNSFKEAIDGRSESPTAIRPFNPEDY